VLAACGAHRAPRTTDGLVAHEGVAPQVLRLVVTEQALQATVARGAARITFEAERGPVIDYAAMGDRRNAAVDPPGVSSTLLCDRRGHVIAIAGTSSLHAGDWERRLEVEPTRTKAEAAADLTLARDAADVLLQDERAHRWFRWELLRLRDTAQELLSASSPSAAETEYSP